MSADRAALEQALAHGETEGGHIEFKERLTRTLHLSDGRKESLVAQLRHRILSGDGKATYVVGVTDEGGIAGISQDAFSETMDVLSLLAEEADAHINDVETWAAGEDGIVGVATISEGAMLAADDGHIVIGTAGHVDHGKSTLIGSLVTGKADDGDGLTRSFLDVQPHEIERGLSADLSYAVYGFDGDGEPIRMDNPHRKSDRARVVEESNRLVSFVDTVGHEPWLRTTIRGLVGQKIDYGLLVVAADDGPTKTTREHLGILLATELPTLVTITKVDAVSEERVAEVEKEVESLLRDVQRTPLRVGRYSIDDAAAELSETVVPILHTSAVRGDGMDDLDRLFGQLPKRTADDEGEFQMYIDRTYNVTGVGAVASGTINAGHVEAGDELLLGPMADGSFREVEVRSIEMHYHRVDAAKAGRIVGIALKGVQEAEIDRGMVLLPRHADPTPTRSFTAEVMVLNHPTRISEGYEPVVHLETVSETAVFSPADGKLLPGDTGRATVEFKFHPYFVEEGQRFVFREGSSKGVGTVVETD